jgi:hypothetical protein
MCNIPHLLLWSVLAAILAILAVNTTRAVEAWIGHSNSTIRRSATLASFWAVVLLYVVGAVAFVFLALSQSAACIAN